MRHPPKKYLKLIFIAAVLLGLDWSASSVLAETVALWLFDEQVGIYPSSVLGDASPVNCPLVLGPGGQIVPGKFGNGLEPSEQPPAVYPAKALPTGLAAGEAGNSSRDRAEPMTWGNAMFCALMSRGERHLRQEVNFASPTRNPLNLGDFDWTVEFWFFPISQSAQGDGADRAGVVFEVGTGPRGGKRGLTRLLLNADRRGFTLENLPNGNRFGGLRLAVPSQPTALDPAQAQWHHLAFVYTANSNQLRHYVDGKLQTLPTARLLQSLEKGTEDYMSIGRDGLWQRPLPGRLDELRFSDNQVYTEPFAPPGSFSKYTRAYRPPKLKAGPKPIFADGAEAGAVVPLAGRKYLFLDDAIVAEMENVHFVANPPRLAERVVDQVSGHLIIRQDRQGLLYLYLQGPQRSLAVLTSRDGVHWKKPDLGSSYHGARNVVIEDPVGLGTLFEDPNAPPSERIKYFSGYRGRGCYVWSSPDGIKFQRNETSALPFRCGSQSIVYYDDQRQVYVGYHRSDMRKTIGNKTLRTSVMTETADLMRPWPLRPLSQSQQAALAQTERLGWMIPFYLDNGPMTPSGFGIEYPTVFTPEESRDPVGTDIYVPKNVKYPWAPDTYLAFPIFYFHYQGDGPPSRRHLGEQEQNRGSGPVETQLATSRDGIHWRRYPRPTYLGIGRHGGLDLHRAYIAHGMVRRGEEIWQYYLGEESYHSPWSKGGRNAVFRVVQRVDGFVSADTPYTGGMLKTRPLVFQGNRLVLNIDTDATGFAQVGLVDAAGKPIEGYGVDDCIYINGDFIETEVEWLKTGKDLSPLAGKPVQLVFRMRGSKLYSMQFQQR